MRCFLKGSFFCVLALLIGTEASALMVKYFPCFTKKLASIVVEKDDIDDQCDMESEIYDPIVLDVSRLDFSKPFGTTVEINLDGTEFVPCGHPDFTE